jgi:hypothetical protein
MKKIMVGLMILISMGILAGCVDDLSNTSYVQQKGVENVKTGDTFLYESKETEQNQKRLIESTPVPRLQTSLERKNLATRLLLLNDENRLFYVYLISYGKVVSYYTAKGKISSVNSYLTASEQIVSDPDCKYRTDMPGEGSCYMAVEAPDQDGSYGSNGNGIFFFTTEGAYVEWNGEYLISDFPLDNMLKN